jgi:oligoendopeptidase F
MNKIIEDCTQWDNSHIFTSLDDPKIEKLLIECKSDILNLTNDSNKLSSSLNDLKNEQRLVLPNAINLLIKSNEIQVELSTISTFCSCITSVDAKNEKAKKILSQVRSHFTDLSKMITPLDLYFQEVDEDTLEEILGDDIVAEWSFQIKHSRLMKDFSLDNAQEQIITTLSQDGLDAWGKLYNTIAGNLEVDIDGEKLGFAKASSILRQGDRDKREIAWRGIGDAWRVHEESSAAILNAINGWRIENGKLRSSKKEFHHFDKSCHQSHITRKTLNSLMDTTFENRSIGQRALKSMAKSIGVETLGPWDILAPAPCKAGGGKLYGFKESIDLISEAFSNLTPEMGEFAQMMYKKNWIDAKETDFRSPGAYCTGFSKYREPRVFMTFDGSMGNVITLAHELGHAYHNWVMKDMHIVRTHYAMTTAETASIFGETLVRDYLFEHSKNDADKFEVAWQDAESAGAMLCNIPARFEFEKNLVEKRKSNNVSPREMKAMMSDAWKVWYEDSLTEYDEMFWATKLHFSISQLGFYNYPYLFGYLFSLGIYAQKDNYGDKFNELYTNILRDTGSMNAVDLINKHFGKSIEEKDFWQGSLDIVNKAVTRFEGLV